MMSKVHRIVVVSAIAIMYAPPACSARQFNFDSDIGVAAKQAGTICLSIDNADLAPGRRVVLVVLGTSQSIANAVVKAAAARECGDSHAKSPGSSFYKLRMLDGAPEPNGPAIAVIDPARSLSVSAGVVTGDLEGNLVRDYFRACTSSEGVHLTVWSGKPLKGRRRWHSYYFLGYDLQATCTVRDLSSR
jgi:hypothetical protein